MLIKAIKSSVDVRNILSLESLNVGDNPLFIIIK